MAAETRLSITRSLDFSFFFPEKTVWTFWNFSVFYDLCLCVCVLSHFSHFWLCVTLGTVAHQAPPSMGFSRQEYWSGLPFPPPENRPDPGIKPTSPAAPALQADSLPLSHQGSPLMWLHPGKPILSWNCQKPKMHLIHLTYGTPALNPAWAVACQVPLSRGFSRQEYWSGLPYPPPGDLPNPGIKPTSPAAPALAGAGSLPLRPRGNP